METAIVKGRILRELLPFKTLPKTLTKVTLEKVGMTIQVRPVREYNKQQTDESMFEVSVFEHSDIHKLSVVEQRVPYMIHLLPSTLERIEKVTKGSSPAESIELFIKTALEIRTKEV